MAFASQAGAVGRAAAPALRRSKHVAPGKSHTMSNDESADGLEVSQDVAFSKREWRAQRIGRVIWLLLVVAAVAGVFGHGWLAKGRARSSDGILTVEYDRIARSQSPTQLQIDISKSSPDETLQLWIKRGYLDDCLIRMISPEPNRTATSMDRIVYSVETLARDGPGRLILVVEPEVIGRREIELGVVGGPQLVVTQFILP
jgi:hypothetical protein